jgi:hypothetical protein
MIDTSETEEAPAPAPAAAADRSALQSAELYLTQAIELADRQDGDDTTVAAPHAAAYQRAAFAGAQACALVSIARTLDRLLDELLAEQAGGRHAPGTGAGS